MEKKEGEGKVYEEVKGGRGGKGKRELEGEKTEGKIGRGQRG